MNVGPTADSDGAFANAWLLGALLVAAASGCSSSPRPATHPVTPGSGAGSAHALTEPGEPGPAAVEPAQPAERVRVTVLSAELIGLMPNGEEWDARAPNGEHIDPPLDAYLEQHPELMLTIGTLGVPIDAPDVEGEARKSKAADPMVLVEVGPTVYRSPMRPKAFSPRWSFAFELVVDPTGGARGLAPDTLVRLHIVDYDSPTRFDTMGSTVMTVGELIASPLHRLGPFGGVTKLVVQVDRTAIDPAAAVSEPVAQRLAVPGNAPWTDTGIDVLAGQRVVIEAADEMCSAGSDLSKCAGPEGQPRTSDYNLDGFGWLGHGALIASIGDTRVAVRRSLSFVAPASGRLRLGVNDRKTSDNRGAFAVRVSVSPP